MYSFVHSRVNLGQRQLCTVIVTLLGLFTKPHIKPTGPGNNTIFSKCKQEIVSLNIGHSVRVSMHIQSTRHKCKDFVYVICVEFLYINKSMYTGWVWTTVRVQISRMWEGCFMLLLIWKCDDIFITNKLNSLWWHFSGKTELLSANNLLQQSLHYCLTLGGITSIWHSSPSTDKSLCYLT